MQGNTRSAGFTDEERQSFETNFLAKGFVDTFREQHPGIVGYTYWGYRHGARKTNRGTFDKQSLKLVYPFLSMHKSMICFRNPVWMGLS